METGARQIRMARWAVAAAGLLALVLAALSAPASAGGWVSTAVPLEADNPYYDLQPHVAVDDNGYAIAVWAGYYNGRLSAMESRYEVGADGWTAPAPLESNDTVDILAPRVACNSAGNAVAIWQQYGAGVWDLWANEFRPGTGWEGAHLIETDDTGSVRDANVSFGPGAYAVVVWAQSDGARDNAYSRLYATGTVGWGSVRSIEDMDNGSAASPAAGVDANGKVVVVWKQYDGGLFSLWGASYRYQDGSIDPVLLETRDDTDATEPWLAVDSAGNALAAWTQSDGNSTDIWTNPYSAKDGTWGTASRVEGDRALNSSAPHAALDDDGNAFVVWHQWDGAHLQAWARTYTVKAGWGNATALLPLTGNFYDPRIAADNAGNALAIFNIPTGSGNLWSAKFTQSGGWAFPEPVATLASETDSQEVDLAFDAGGNATAVWQTFNGAGRFSVYAARYVETTPPPLLIVTPSDGLSTELSQLWVNGTTEPGAAVRVDGVDAAVDGAGAFSLLVTLTAGNQTITVVAEDPAHNLASGSVTVTYHPPGATLGAAILDQAVDENETATFAVLITNPGDDTNTVNLTAVSALGWTAAFEVGSIDLAPWANTTVNLAVRVPHNAAPLLVDNITLTARSSRPFAPDVSMVVVTRVRAQAFAPELSADVEAITHAGGSSAVYTVTVTNAGNNHDTFALTAGAAPLGWVITLSQASAALDRGASASFTVTVDVPQSLAGTLVWAALVTATASDGTTAATLSLNTSVGLPDFALSPSDIALSTETPAFGEVVNITVTVRNLGFSMALDIVVRLSTGSSNLSQTVSMPLAGTAFATFAWTATGGQTQLQFTADATNGFPESNENNNVASKTLTVNSPPHAAFTIGGEAHAGSAVTFSAATSTDPDSTVAGYYFDFGDGTNSGWVTSPTVTHTYANAGTFTVTVKARDSAGAESAGTTSTVTVGAPDGGSSMLLVLLGVAAAGGAGAFLFMQARRKTKVDVTNDPTAKSDSAPPQSPPGTPPK